MALVWPDSSNAKLQINFCVWWAGRYIWVCEMKDELSNVPIFLRLLAHSIPLKALLCSGCARRTWSWTILSWLNIVEVEIEVNSSTKRVVRVLNVQPPHSSTRPPCRNWIMTSLIFNAHPRHNRLSKMAEEDVFLAATSNALWDPVHSKDWDKEKVTPQCVLRIKR